MRVYCNNIIYLLFSWSLCGCLRVAEDRAILEERIGQAEYEGLRFLVDEGASSIRSVHQEDDLLIIDLWAQRPKQSLRIDPAGLKTRPPKLRVVWHNLMDASIITLKSEGGSELPITKLNQAFAPLTQFELEFPLSTVPLILSITPPNLEDNELIVGVFADVQERLDGLPDLLIPLGKEPIHFCLISGDLTSQGTVLELKEFQAGLERYLPFPCYATLGNHELGTSGPPFHALFGKGNGSFEYGGVRITLLDDASATLAPRTHKKLKKWLSLGRDQLHVIVTHLPILDVDGTRSGAFASRLEAIELLAALSEGEVDLLLYGHVHTYKSFKQSGIRALISGGGGSIPMRFDGIGRHYLVIDFNPVTQQFSHRVQEISPEE